MQRGSMRGKIHPSGLDRTGIGYPNYPELEPGPWLRRKPAVT